MRTSGSGQRSVLVVEPSPTFGRKVAELCTSAGARVQTHATLSDAIESIERSAPDALIIARVLGALPGESLVAALRASPLHQHLAIAILSSDAECNAQIAAARPDRIIARDANLSDSIADFLSEAFKAPDAATSIRELRAGANTQDRALQGRRLLVVDDMESTRRLLNLLLTRHGASVTLSEGGHEAAELVSGENDLPELVLMDYEMPDMNGKASLDELRRRGYTGPVLLCSGHDDPEFIEHALTLGFCGVIPKSQTHTQLYARCAQVLQAAA